MALFKEIMHGLYGAKGSDFAILFPYRPEPFHIFEEKYHTNFVVADFIIWQSCWLRAKGKLNTQIRNKG